MAVYRKLWVLEVELAVKASRILLMRVVEISCHSEVVWFLLDKE